MNSGQKDVPLRDLPIAKLAKTPRFSGYAREVLRQRYMKTVVPRYLGYVSGGEVVKHGVLLRSMVRAGVIEGCRINDHSFS